MMTCVGVLALQGNFGAHCSILNKLGLSSREIRSPPELNQLDALIIPGGESISIMKLIQRAHLFEPIVQFAEDKPIFGICAGLILMAEYVQDFDLPTFKLLDIEVQRNAYGRQLDSLIDSIEFDHQLIDVAFIRAPKITSVGKGITTLANWQDQPVVICNQQHMAATCHPELFENTALHDYFLTHFLI